MVPRSLKIQLPSGHSEISMATDQQARGGAAVLAGDSDPGCHKKLDLLLYNGGKKGSVPGMQGTHWASFGASMASHSNKWAAVAVVA